MSYTTNIHDALNRDENFRRVIFTGEKSQLVLMQIPPGGEIGTETHPHVEQTLFFMKGEGKSILNGEERMIHEGDVYVVTPGTEHNFINTGTIPLEVYTVYTPPNHIDGRVHKTKEEADADVADEEFGSRVS